MTPPDPPGSHDRADNRRNGHLDGSQTGVALDRGNSEAEVRAFWQRNGFWRPPAAKTFRKGNDEACWKRHMEARRQPVGLTRLARSDASPLVWGVCREQLTASTAELLALASDQGASKFGARKASRVRARLLSALHQWNNAADHCADSLDFALGCLAVAHLLPAAATKLKPEICRRVVWRLWQIAEDARGSVSDEQATAESTVAIELLVGELPLTLSYLFPEMRPLHSLRPGAREWLSTALVESTNGAGLLAGRLIGHFSLLLASWTRCRLIGTELKKSCWSKKAESQYRWMVRQALLWTAPSATPLLAAPICHAPWPAEFFLALLRLAGDGADFAAARELFGRRIVYKGESGKRYHTPDTSENCEWSGLAVLRTNWQSDAAVLAVRYQGTETQLELAVGTAAALRGICASTTWIDGVEVMPVGSWEEVCWVSDADADYLELSIGLEQGARLDRQFLLARRDRALWMADHIVCPPATSIRHSLQLPLAEKVSIAHADQTREAFLVAARPIAAALPLALPEWRSDPRVGAMESPSGKLVLTQEMAGSALACPLFFDLQPQRSKAQVTWRQLTVAQSLAIQPQHVAAGFRAQCGQQQWLFYRALLSRGNRTVLGQNTSSEFLAARFFAATGETDTLIEIEG